jgi:hypothetical protein
MLSVLTGGADPAEAVQFALVVLLRVGGEGVSSFL